MSPYRGNAKKGTFQPCHTAVRYLGTSAKYKSLGSLRGFLKLDILDIYFGLWYNAHKSSRCGVLAIGFLIWSYIKKPIVPLKLGSW